MLQTILTFEDVPIMEYAPFTVVRHGRGQWQVLDADGFDFIGQYVTKRDADRYLRVIPITN